MAGGLGKFHWLLFVILSLVLMTGEVYNSMVLYFNKTPELLCTYKDGVKKECDWATACFSSDDDIISHEPD